MAPELLQGALLGGGKIEFLDRRLAEQIALIEFLKRANGEQTILAGRVARLIGLRERGSGEEQRNDEQE